MLHMNKIFVFPFKSSIYGLSNVDIYFYGCKLHKYFKPVLCFLAHLWGAYAIPVALSGVRRTSCVVCVHHNYQK